MFFSLYVLTARYISIPQRNARTSLPKASEPAGADCSRRLAELRHRDPHEHAEKKCRYKIADEYNPKSGKITLLVALDYISDPAGVKRVALERQMQNRATENSTAPTYLFSQARNTQPPMEINTPAQTELRKFQHISIFSADRDYLAYDIGLFTRGFKNAERLVGIVL